MSEEQNLTLLSCSEVPEVHYLGENASLFLRYLNATRRGALPGDAAVTSESLDARAASERVDALWRSRSLIVHDKAAYRDRTETGSKLAAQLAGGARRAASIWAAMDADVEAARRYVASAMPELLEGPPDAAALKALLLDFKDRYPYYSGRCDHCGRASTDFVGEISASAEEARLARAGRVELRVCGACDATTEFVRANDVRYALETSKRGRCGEYSATFLAILSALGLDARWVFDTTDHVWCEVRLDDAWVHVDPCEASIDEPQIYSGWGKNGTLVVAFDDRAAEDVTHVYYPTQTKDIRKRRKTDGLDKAAVQRALDAYVARAREAPPETRASSPHRPGAI